LVALEELDTAHPLVLTTINNAIAGDHFANDATGELIPRHPDFRIVATANTLGTGATREYNGRSKLDGATLDRFRVGRVFVGLDPKLERAVWDLITANYAPRRRELDRYWSEVERLRTFVAGRDAFDAFDSMRIKFDGANAIGCGAPVEAVLASITATWGDDTRAQARVAGFDYAGFTA
jgi:MoxR-like ATPase